MKNSFKALLLSLLIAATAVFTTACSDENGGGATTTPSNSAAISTAEESKPSENTEKPVDTTKAETEANPEVSTQAETNADTGSQTQGEEPGDLWSGAKYTEDTEVGEGAVTLKVKVVAGEKTITITVHTDKDNLGDALVENDLVAGDESEYGLYIKSVNGILADYDKDQSWWAISKDGEMLSTGADSTPIADGENYELTYTKG